MKALNLKSPAVLLIIFAGLGRCYGANARPVAIVGLAQGSSSSTKTIITQQTIAQPHFSDTPGDCQILSSGNLPQPLAPVGPILQLSDSISSPLRPPPVRLPLEPCNWRKP
jgi:hypothetical protein